MCGIYGKEQSLAKTREEYHGVLSVDRSIIKNSCVKNPMNSEIGRSSDTPIDEKLSIERARRSSRIHISQRIERKDPSHKD